MSCIMMIYGSNDMVCLVKSGKLSLNASNLTNVEIKDHASKNGKEPVGLEFDLLLGNPFKNSGIILRQSDKVFKNLFVLPWAKFSLF